MLRYLATFLSFAALLATFALGALVGCGDSDGATDASCGGADLSAMIVLDLTDAPDTSADDFAFREDLADVRQVQFDFANALTDCSCAPMLFVCESRDLTCVPLVRQ